MLICLSKINFQIFYHLILSESADEIILTSACENFDIYAKETPIKIIHQDGKENSSKWSFKCKKDIPYHSKWRSWYMTPGGHVSNFSSTSMISGTASLTN